MEDQRRRQAKKMLESSVEENGYIFSTLTTHLPSRPRKYATQAIGRRVAPTPTHDVSSAEAMVEMGDFYGDSFPHCTGKMEGSGYGRQLYGNGDFYEGGWRRNVQEGEGSYVWRNGNQYIGEWKNGVISGKGIFIWANGNRYSGEWENGVPKFTWTDGSCNSIDSDSSLSFSSESNGKSFQNEPWSFDGTFCSSQWPMTFKLSDSTDVSSIEWRGSYTGKICIWDSDGEAGDITCDIIDTIESSLACNCKGVFGKAIEEQQKQQRWNPWCFIGVGEQKKPGNTISKGHKFYDLMRNLQLGIR